MYGFLDGQRIFRKGYDRNHSTGLCRAIATCKLELCRPSLYILFPTETVGIIYFLISFPQVIYSTTLHETCTRPSILCFDLLVVKMGTRFGPGCHLQLPLVGIFLIQKMKCTCNVHFLYSYYFAWLGEALSTKMWIGFTC